MVLDGLGADSDWYDDRDVEIEYEGDEWLEVMMREYISTGECFCVWVGGLFEVGVGVGWCGW